MCQRSMIGSGSHVMIAVQRRQRRSRRRLRDSTRKLTLLKEMRRKGFTVEQFWRRKGGMFTKRQLLHWIENRDSLRKQASCRIRRRRSGQKVVCMYFVAVSGLQEVGAEGFAVERGMFGMEFFRNCFVERPWNDDAKSDLSRRDVRPLI